MAGRRMTMSCGSPAAAAVLFFLPICLPNYIYRMADGAEQKYKRGTEPSPSWLMLLANTIWWLAFSGQPRECAHVWLAPLIIGGNNRKNPREDLSGRGSRPLLNEEDLLFLINLIAIKKLGTISLTRRERERERCPCLLIALRPVDWKGLLTGFLLFAGTRCF